MTVEHMNPRLAERLTRAARAAQTLSETLWEALHEELAGWSESGQHAMRVAELSERLVDVSATVALLARVDAGASATSKPHVAPTDQEGAPTDPEGAPTDPEGAPADRGPSAVRVAQEEQSHGPPAREAHMAREPSAAREPPSVAVLVDELAPESSPETEITETEITEIEIKDERRERDPTAWIASIGRMLKRYEQDGLGFAVLLVELVDIERLRHAELPGEVARLTGLVETALANELRPADSLTRESPGRYWLLAPETDSSSARALAVRLAEAVRDAAGHRGAPLQIAVGVAVCPADGSRASELAAHADIALYAARAAGRPVA